MAGSQSSETVGKGKRAPRERSASGLWIVATPIGNLGDWSQRARDVLAEADIVACEDTRRTGRLLSFFGIKARLVSYHDHSPPRVRESLIGHLKSGKVVALVSDAGTPLISDPGYKLVRCAIDEDIAIHCAPGPSSLLAALVLSGLPTDRFLFAGYPPPKVGPRTKFFEEIAAVPATLIFFESPHRLAASLTTMVGVLGDRPAALAREITKLHEEVKRERLTVLLSSCQNIPPPKGELVIVVAPPQEPGSSMDEVETLLDKALESMGVRDAASVVAEATGRSRKEIYTRALQKFRPASSRNV